MKTQPENLIAILVRYHAATDTRGARVSLTWPALDSFAKDPRIFIPWNHEQSSAREIALAWFEGEKRLPAKTVMDCGAFAVLGFELRKGEILAAIFGI